MSIDFNFQQIEKVIGQVWNNDLPQMAAQITQNVEFLGKMVSDATYHVTPALLEGIEKIKALWNGDIVPSIKNGAMIAISNLSSFLDQSPIFQELQEIAFSCKHAFGTFVETCVYASIGNPIRL